MTHLQFNREGDLLFSSAKDNKVSVWYTDNGERLGTYNQHNGAVWHVDVNRNSTLLLTAGADACAKLWDVETGVELFNFEHLSSVRSVGFAEGDGRFLTVSENNMGQKVGTINIYKLNTQDLRRQDSKPIMTITGHEGKITCAAWGDCNRTILSAGEDGCLKWWDAESGEEIDSLQFHSDEIIDMRFNEDKTMVITSGKDNTARLFDVIERRQLHVYNFKFPVNSAVMSPLHPHIILGGGQDAMNTALIGAGDVTQSFASQFYHVFYQDWLGSVPGHFGPINTVAVSPCGKFYATGAEDGYIRLMHFDEKYLKYKSP